MLISPNTFLLLLGVKKLEKWALDQNEKYHSVQNKTLFNYKVISLVLLTHFYISLFWNENAAWKWQVCKLNFPNMERNLVAIFSIYFLFPLPAFPILNPHGWLQSLAWVFLWPNHKHFWDRHLQLSKSQTSIKMWSTFDESHPRSTYFSHQL